MQYSVAFDEKGMRIVEEGGKKQNEKTDMEQKELAFFFLRFFFLFFCLILEFLVGFSIKNGLIVRRSRNCTYLEAFIPFFNIVTAYKHLILNYFLSFSAPYLLTHAV